MRISPFEVKCSLYIQLSTPEEFQISLPRSTKKYPKNTSSSIPSDSDYLHDSVRLYCKFRLCSICMYYVCRRRNVEVVQDPI